MTKPIAELEKWYEENIGEFDVEQGNMIEYLMDLARKTTKQIPKHFIQEKRKRKWDYIQLTRDVGLRPVATINPPISYGTTYPIVQKSDIWYRVHETKNSGGYTWFFIKNKSNIGGWVMKQFCELKTTDQL